MNEIKEEAEDSKFQTLQQQKEIEPEILFSSDKKLMEFKPINMSLQRSTEDHALSDEDAKYSVEDYPERGF